LVVTGISTFLNCVYLLNLKVKELTVSVLTLDWARSLLKSSPATEHLRVTRFG